ncbi:hypothetical protein [Paraburkholderia bannensis]|uniref:hypothetical protein n=1 Tax=Paraburkholderia bannensis TaxID=765414 RepID=UPI002AB1A381|nr:hypothetical protein [Paraburkholderia bannensis]
MIGVNAALARHASDRCGNRMIEIFFKEGATGAIGASGASGAIGTFWQQLMQLWELIVMVCHFLLGLLKLLSGT